MVISSTIKRRLLLVLVTDVSTGVVPPLVMVRKIDGPTPTNQLEEVPHSRPVEAVEPSPIVVVEKRIGLRRRLARYKNNLDTFLRLAEETREDIRHTEGQLAELE